MEGCFWGRPSPDQPEFAPVGTVVEKGATIALIEVMKTFTPIRASMAGTIEGWVAADGDGVSPNQIIGWIRAN